MPRQRTQPARLQSAPLPAPVGGINTVDAATAMPVTDALALVNLVGGRVGLTTRLGYQEHATGLGEAARTIIPFAGATTADDRLFVATKEGIYDCTGAEPSQMVAFPGDPAEDAGWGVFTGFVTNGGRYILYADEEHGLYLYDDSGSGTWAAVAHTTTGEAGKIGSGTAGQDVDPADVAFVMGWKNRIWLVKKGSGDAFFLPVGQVTGETQRHSFGNKFRSGGELVGLWNWSINGGEGMDDRLVAISSAGDVLIYAGSDPAQASAFELISSWSVGGLPAGRRIATDFGGDVLILSLLGVIPVSKLITGTIAPDVYTTRKIQALFSEYANDRKDLLGWSLRLHPGDNALLINMPLLGNEYEQFAMSLATQGWSLYRGVPSLSSEVWRGKLYFGTTDGRVCVATGGLDNVEVAGTTNARAIEWSGLTSFQSQGAPVEKRIQLITARGTTQGAPPGLVLAARYDFDQSAISTNPPEPDNSSLAIWDTAKWDEAEWAGEDTPTTKRSGASGIGVYAAVAFRGKSTARTTLLGFEVAWDNGGIL